MNQEKNDWWEKQLEVLSKNLEGFRHLYEEQ